VHRRCHGARGAAVEAGSNKNDEPRLPSQGSGGKVSPLDVKRWLRQSARQDFEERLRQYDLAHAPGAPPEMKVLADTIADVYRLPETRWPYLSSRATVERQEYISPDEQPKIAFKPGLTPGQYRAKQEIEAFTKAASEAAVARTNMGVGALGGVYDHEGAAVEAVAADIRTAATKAAEVALASEMMTRVGSSSKRPS